MILDFLRTPSSKLSMPLYTCYNAFIIHHSSTTAPRDLVEQHTPPLSEEFLLTPDGFLFLSEFIQPQFTGKLHMPDMHGEMLNDVQDRPPDRYDAVPKFPRFFQLGR